MLGIEHVRIVSGDTVFTPLDFYDYPISHSLAGVIGWGILFGIIYFLIKKDARSALAAGLCVMSHWFLDFVTHRPDLPLLPNSKTYYGLGLWNSVYATIVVEMVIFLIGVYVYAKITLSRNRVGFNPAPACTL